ncbi:MAG: FAD-dependent oxidoreductase, partial [Owenweeksia sp.]
MSNIKDITIIGGGITGLATAYLAAKGGHKVRILEASPKLGGLLNTFEIQGSRLEFYYHHFFTHDAELNWLIRELGIDDKLIFRETSMGVLRNGKIFNFNTPVDLLKFSPIGLFDKLRFGFSSLYLGKVANWKDFENVPAIKWLYKWAGKGTTKSLWEPLLNIKFGPFADVVPLSWMVGRLRQRMNSRKGGDERLGYLEGSLQVLLDALVAQLTEMGVEFHTQSPVQSVEIENDKLVAVQTPSQ